MLLHLQERARRCRRLLIIILFCATNSSCTLNMAGAIKDARQELKQQLQELDPSGQEALRQSWYGKLLNLLYAQSEGQAILRDRLDDRQVAELQALLQQVVTSILPSGGEINSAAPLRAALSLPKAGGKISIVVLKDDAHQILVSPECDRAAITFSAEAVREIVKAARNQGEVSQLQQFAEQLFFGMFNIDPSVDETNLGASSVAVLFGPPRSKFVTKKLEQELGAQGTVVWKALAFIIGHEAHHLWSQKCERTNDAEQRLIEAKADVLGTVLAITTYNRRCGRDLVASRQDALVMLSDEAPPASYPSEVRFQMNIVPSPNLLVGASGIATMQAALGPFFDADPSHPTPTARISIDDRGAESLASKLFGQPINRSWMASLISKMADVPKDEVIAQFYNGLEFKPNYHLVDNYLICTNIEFQSKPEKRPGMF